MAVPSPQVRCVGMNELDKKIEHFHRLAARFTDHALLNGIRELIERAEVGRLHFTPSRPPEFGGLFHLQPVHVAQRAPVVPRELTRAFPVQHASALTGRAADDAHGRLDARSHADTASLKREKAARSAFLVSWPNLKSPVA
jgi:hypothetical protein